MSQQQSLHHATLAERMRFCREKAGMSMSDLGRKSGVSVAYISRLESGKNTDLKNETALKIAMALDADTEWLLHGAKEHGTANGSTQQLPCNATSNLQILEWREKAKKWDALMEQTKQDVEKECAPMEVRVAALERAIINFVGAKTT